MFDNYNDVLSVEEVSKALLLGKTKVYQLLKTQTIKSIKVGRKYLVPKIFLIDFVDKFRYT